MNAKEEFIRLAKSSNDVIVCASIHFGMSWEDDESDIEKILLKENYSEDDYQFFLSAIDRDYDNGYGGQELFGVVWFKTCWAGRGEYDGSEWWNLQIRPEIPDYLKSQ